MNKNFQVLMGMVLAASLHQAVAQQADEDTQASNIAAEVCSQCHGPGGVSTNPMFPILAAQTQDYIVNQLNAFRSKKRSEPDALEDQRVPHTRFLPSRLAS